MNREHRKRAALYARCSLGRQQLEAQQKELIDHAKRQGWQYRIYADHGQSGAKEQRPALDRMLADIRAGKIDVIAAWSLDRVARSLRSLLNFLHELKTRRVGFVAVKQGLDLSQDSPTQTLTWAVLSAVAEFERELLRQRVRTGMAHAKRKGKTIGRPSKRTFNPQETAAMRRAIQQKIPLRQVARQFGTTSFTVRKLTGFSSTRVTRR